MTVLLDQQITTLQEGEFTILPSIAYANPAHTVWGYVTIATPHPGSWKVPLLYLTVVDTFTRSGRIIRYERESRSALGSGMAIQLIRNNGSEAFYLYRRRNNDRSQMTINWRIVNFSVSG